MSGPQGPDPTEPYSQPYSGSQPHPGSQQYPGSEPPPDETRAAYGPPDYPSYQQQSTPGYAEQYPPQNQPYGSGQYGQQPGQYGQFGQQPDAGASPPSKKGSGAVIAVLGVLAVIIVAAVLVLGFWKPGFFVTTKLDVGKAQSGVEQVLKDKNTGYGEDDVKDVKCNNGENPTVKKGDTFECEVTVDNNFKTVQVTFLDDDGTYEVGRPTAG